MNKQLLVTLFSVSISCTLLLPLFYHQQTQLHTHQKRSVELESQLKQLQSEQAQLSSLPGEVKKMKRELSFHDQRENTKVAYLTFDDGPSYNTTAILNTLKKYHVQATFFVNGTLNPDLLPLYKRILDEGHTIGNHTFTHHYPSIYSSLPAFQNDVHRLQNHFLQTAGITTRLFRFPGGSNNTVSHAYGGKSLMPQLASALHKEGYVYYDWNVDSTDALAASRTPQQIIDAISLQIQDKHNAIILLHDGAGKQSTAKALPVIIEQLLAAGFDLRPLHPQSFNHQFIEPKN